MKLKKIYVYVKLEYDSDGEEIRTLEVYHSKPMKYTYIDWIGKGKLYK